MKLKRGFWTKVLDIVAGAPEIHNLVRPYSVVADSRGRVIVTDPGIPAIHVFDFERQKYKLIRRAGKQQILSPQCVALDAQDNFYVTDSDAGKIFAYSTRTVTFAAPSARSRVARECSSVRQGSRLIPRANASMSRIHGASRSSSWIWMVP